MHAITQRDGASGTAIKKTIGQLPQNFIYFACIYGVAERAAGLWTGIEKSASQTSIGYVDSVFGSVTCICRGVTMMTVQPFVLAM